MDDDQSTQPLVTASDNFDDKFVGRPISEHPLTVLFRYLYEIIKTAVGILIIATLIRAFLIQPFVVDGSSMEPSFHNHEYLLTQKVSLYTHKIGRGDTIVFKYPLDPRLNYVKRVIGLPGDKITISKGKVTVYNNQNPNGLELKESYLPTDTVTKVNGDLSERTWVVDPNSYFVLGDNRDHSDDSRTWNFVPYNNIVGEVWMTVYPFSNFGTVSHPSY